MIVVDTNIVAYLYLFGQHTATAVRAYEIDPVWAVPRLWLSEFRNILSLYLRQDLLDLHNALQIMAEAERSLTPNEYAVPSGPVLQLAAASQHSAYDCEFVALARQLGVNLVTMDPKILTLFPQTAVSLPDFVKN